MDIGKDAGEEEVRGCDRREEDRDERELLEAPREHADEERVCKEEEDDRDEREDDDGRGPDLEGEPGADGEHADEIREHLSEDDG